MTAIVQPLVASSGPTTRKLSPGLPLRAFRTAEPGSRLEVLRFDVSEGGEARIELRGHVSKAPLTETYRMPWWGRIGAQLYVVVLELEDGAEHEHVLEFVGDHHVRGIEMPRLSQLASQLRERIQTRSPLALLEAQLGTGKSCRYLLGASRARDDGHDDFDALANENGGRPVVFRTLDAERSRDERARSGFLACAREAARLEHPHIVRTLELLERVPAAVLDPPEGRTLREVLADEGRVALERALSWLDALADALEHAHARSVLHGRLRIGHIIISESDRPLIDHFGYALGDDGTAALEPIVGNALSLAPECLASKRASVRTDVYLLGQIAFELLTGQHPFASTAHSEMIDRKRLGRPKRWIDFRPNLPSAAGAALERALAVEPNDRWPTPRAFAVALRAAFKTLPACYSPQLLFPAHREKGTRSRVVLDWRGVPLADPPRLVPVEAHRARIAKMWREDGLTFMMIVHPSDATLAPYCVRWLGRDEQAQLLALLELAADWPNREDPGWTLVRLPIASKHLDVLAQGRTDLFMWDVPPEKGAATTVRDVETLSPDETKERALTINELLSIGLVLRAADSDAAFGRLRDWSNPEYGEPGNIHAACARCASFEHFQTGCCPQCGGITMHIAGRDI